MKIDESNLTIVHDYLVQMGGAEVVATMAKAFPGAPIYTSATDYEHLWSEFGDKEIHNTWMQRLPKSKVATKALFPLYPLAFRSMRLPSDRQAVWISASTFAKMVPVPRGCASFLAIVRHVFSGTQSDTWARRWVIRCCGSLSGLSCRHCG